MHIVQTVLYQIKDRQPLFLYLKRTPDRGGFWTAVNGTLEENESVKQCATRELSEETGINDVLNWSDELYRFNFDHKGTIMTVLVYAAEVGPNISVVLNEEHTEYRWLPFEEAIELLEFEEDKIALRKVNDYIYQLFL